MVLMRNGPVPAFLAQPDSQTKARFRIFFQLFSCTTAKYGGCERNLFACDDVKRHTAAESLFWWSKNGGHVSR
jgi:hypothetical protein